MEGRIREIDHTGDVGLEIEAPDRRALFETAARGLLQLLVRGGVEGRVARSVRVKSTESEELLLDWLNEILSVADLHGEVYREARVIRLEDREVEGVLRGEPFDPERHEPRFGVKAATYHRYRCEEGPGGWRARVIFDL
jgi:SHS2 domain-containing protein